MNLIAVMLHHAFTVLVDVESSVAPQLFDIETCLSIGQIIAIAAIGLKMMLCAAMKSVPAHRIPT